MLFQVYNGAMQTTAAPTKVTTGTAIKTMMQVKGLVLLKIVEWGWSFDGSAAATPGTIELVETGSVAATVTANVAADITQLDAEALLLTQSQITSNYISVGTGATGFTASAEGTITASRNLAGPQLGAPTNQFIQQFPLGQEPIIQIGNIARIRVTFGTAVNMLCYLKLAA